MVILQAFLAVASGVTTLVALLLSALSLMGSGVVFVSCKCGGMPCVMHLTMQQRVACMGRQPVY